MSEVFISYARASQPFVQRLHQALAQCGKDGWVDWIGIPPAAEWMKEIEEAIDAADVFAFVVGAASLRSAVCAQELAHAVAGCKRLIPLLCEDVAIDDIPAPLRARQLLFFRPSDPFDTALDRLVEAIDRDLAHAKEHTRWHLRASRWEAHGKDPSLLLRDLELDESRRWLAASPGKEPRVTPLQTVFIETSGTSLAEARRNDAQRLAAMRRNGYCLQLSRVAALDDTDSALAQRLLEDLENTPLDLRDYCWGYLHRRFLGGHVVLRGHAGRPRSTALSYDGRIAAVGYEDGSICVWADPAVMPRTIAANGGSVRRLAMTPDGTQLASIDWEGMVRWWDVSTCAQLGSLSLGDVSHVALSIRPRTGVRVVVARGGALWTSALPSRPQLRLLADDEHPILALECSSSGVRFAVLRQGGVIEMRRWDRPDPLASLTGDERMPILALSSDGRRIAWAGSAVDKVELAWGRGLSRRCSIALGKVAHLQFAPDGHALAVTGGTRVPEPRSLLAVCDGVDFQRIRTLHAHMSGGIHCALSADASRVLSCGGDGLAVMHVLQHAGDPSVLAPEHAAAQAIAWSAQGHRFARVNGSVVELVDPSQGTLRRWEDTKFVPSALAFAPDGHWLAAAQQTQLALSGEARVWNTVTGQLQWLHEASACSLAWSPDGAELALGLWGELVIWTVASGSVRRVALDKGAVRALAYSPDGNTLAVAIWRNEVWLLDTGDGTVRGKLVGHSASVIGLAFLDDGRTLVSMSEKDQVLLQPNYYRQKQSPEMIHWDLESQKELRRVELEEDVGIGTRLVAAPDGSTFVTGHADGSLCFWDPVVIRPRMKFQAHRSAVASLAFATDGRTVSSSSRHDGDGLRHWQADEWRNSALLKGHKGNVVALGFTPDSRWLVSGAGYDGGEVMQPGEIFVWDPHTAERRVLFSEHDNAVEQMAVAPDGKTLVAGLQRGLVAFDLASGTVRWRSTAHALPLAYSRDGKVLTAGENKLDPDTGEDTGEAATCEAWPPAIDPRVATVHRRSADGIWFAVGTASGHVLLLDERRPQHVATLAAHQLPVGALAYSPDGLWLATSARESRHREYQACEVILWRLTDLHAVRTLWGHTAGVQAIAFSPDGTYLATGGASQRSISHPGDVRLWHLPSLLAES